ncbi:hypothetical protein SDC9_142371 [bioreactor metagenome]|uniref:Uncharacterized protein n=1 Tax=bioreactor metagenome TaxID=1076179 RepID=A0A645E1F6_9ZZZZ
MVGADLEQGLQVAQLDRGGAGGQRLGGLAQLGRGLQLAVGVDHLGAAFPLGLGLPRHRALHALGQLDVLDLHDPHLDAPGLGPLVHPGAQVDVEVLAVGQQPVQVDPAEQGSQGGLGDLGGGDLELLDLEDRLRRVDDAEEHHGVHPGGDVVVGDDLLGRDGVGDDAQVHPDEPVHPWDQEPQAGRVDGTYATQAEHDAALVLGDDADRGRQQDEGQDHDGDEDDETDGHRRSLVRKS